MSLSPITKPAAALRRRLLRLSCLLALAALAACSGQVDSVKVSLVGAPGLNPAPGDTANPVQLRLYVLGNADKFGRADYFQLFDNEQATLGADLLGRDEEIVRPGQTRAVTLPAKPGARFFGVAVSYRNIDRATWRAVAPIQSEVHVTLGPDAVTVR